MTGKTNQPEECDVATTYILWITRGAKFTQLFGLQISITIRAQQRRKYGPLRDANNLAIIALADL